MGKQNKESPNGFSLIEVLIVIAIISILTAISMVYLTASQKLYKPDTQSLEIADFFQEARQRSLTQRETMRVEIDMDDNIVRLIDENTIATADDDRVIRTKTLFPPGEIVVDSRPFNISVDPPENPPAPHANFSLSNYPGSIAHRVCTVRFQSNGSVVNAGTTPTGTGAVPTGVTLFIWAPSTGNASNSDITRAITIIGTTGSVRLWEYDPNLAQPNKWKNSRRTSGFGS